MLHDFNFKMMKMSTLDFFFLLNLETIWSYFDLPSLSWDHEILIISILFGQY